MYWASLYGRRPCLGFFDGDGPGVKTMEGERKERKEFEWPSKETQAGLI